MKISIVVAMSSPRMVIGKDGSIPWRLPRDLKRFASITRGNTVLMGRKTYESIGKPLPERNNIVLSRKDQFEAPGFIVSPSFEEALKSAELLGRELFVIGGEEVYRKALSISDTLYVTEVHIDCEGDSYFPNYKKSEWEVVKSEDCFPDLNNKVRHTFFLLRRKSRETASP